MSASIYPSFSSKHAALLSIEIVKIHVDKELRLLIGGNIKYNHCHSLIEIEFIILKTVKCASKIYRSTLNIKIKSNFKS